MLSKPQQFMKLFRRLTPLIVNSQTNRLAVRSFSMKWYSNIKDINKSFFRDKEDFTGEVVQMEKNKGKFAEPNKDLIRDEFQESKAPHATEYRDPAL